MEEKYTVDTWPGPAALRNHLEEVLGSKEFRGSKRSQQFLRFIIEQAIEGHADELKERSLGVELFGREPSYDTGEDAIVRVTASDVRKRLHQYYGDRQVDFRIELPSGSYVPEFAKAAIVMPAGKDTAAHGGRPAFRRVVGGGVLALVLAIVAGWWIFERPAKPPIRRMAPWARMLASSRNTTVVLSDPDISAIQKLTNWKMTLSDYANGRFAPDLTALDPAMQRALRTFRGANVSAVDIPVAIDVVRLLGDKHDVKTVPARSLKLADFKTDDDFVILGSPHSNPWGALYQDQLDFQFAFDEETNHECIRNRKVRSGELEIYVPTARGWGTGQGFAIVALVSNPGQKGKVLLLAGTTAEATSAAGRLAVDAEMLSAGLQKCGIPPSDSAHDFEILVDVRAMAGSPNRFEVRACHVLGATV